MELLRNKTMEFFNLTDIGDIYFTICLQSWVILPIALPLVCMAIYSLFTLIKTGHVAPVYVINLLVSDVLQICAKPIAFSLPSTGVVPGLLQQAYSLGLLASTFFMVCIAGERYVMIAHPMWYRFHRTIKKSFICCATVWMAAIISTGCVFFMCQTTDVRIENLLVYALVMSLLPYPFVLFFLIGTWRALSKSISVSQQEQRRIRGALVLVVLIYSLLFLPYIVILLLVQIYPNLIPNSTFQQMFLITSSLLSLNPLTDPILYVIARQKQPFACPCYSCTPSKVENGQFLTHETHTRL